MTCFRLKSGLGIFLCGAVLIFGCGGGSDVGNPYQPVMGTVTSRMSDGPKAIGARVVIARRGADPGMSDIEAACSVDGDITTCIGGFVFDTTYADVNGQFSFDSIPPAEYALVATYNDLVTIEYIAHGRYSETELAMVVTDPATISLKNYAEIDTSRPYFTAARIAGTEITGTADTNGEILLHNVPAAEKLDLILYRSDAVRELFEGMQTESGCTTELYTLPDLPTERWTPHPCGERDIYGLPYILETISRTAGVTNEELINNDREADLVISFSHDMNVLSTSRAIHGYAEGDSISGLSLWWEGSNLVYIRFCTADTTADCRSGDDRFLPGVTYGVDIDTTAQTSEGVLWAYTENVRFIPVP